MDRDLFHLYGKFIQIVESVSRANRPKPTKTNNDNFANLAHSSEITFDNAEELTEEGKPFLLLFYSPNDTKAIKDFHMNVAADVEGDRGKCFNTTIKVG